MILSIMARRATRRTIRAAPCRSSRRPSRARKTGPSQRSPIEQGSRIGRVGAERAAARTLPVAVIRSNNFVSAAVVIIASATVRTRLAAPSGSWLAAMRSAGPAAMLEPMMWLLAGGGWAAAGKEPLWQAGRLVDGAGSGEPGPGDRSRGGLGRALSGALAEVGAEVVGIDLPGTAVRSTRRGIDPMSSATQDRPAAPVDRRWLVLVVVAIAQLMVVLDSTVVNVALPSAQRSLGFSNGDRQWVVTAYALAFGSLLLVGGRLGDMYSRKWVFIAGLAGFSLSSALGGAATSFGMLVVARTLQGIFGAILAPAALGTLVSTFRDPSERGRAFGVFGSVAGGGGAVGLILGGVLTQYLSWRWTLYVNLIFAAIAAAGALLYMRSNRPDTRPRMDWAGVVLGSAGLFCLVFG